MGKRPSAYDVVARSLGEESLPAQATREQSASKRSGIAPCTTAIARSTPAPGKSKSSMSPQCVWPPRPARARGGVRPGPLRQGRAAGRQPRLQSLAPGIARPDQQSHLGQLRRLSPATAKKSGRGGRRHGASGGGRRGVVRPPGIAGVVQPGQHDGVVAVALGYGSVLSRALRRHRAAMAGGEPDVGRTAWSAATRRRCFVGGRRPAYHARAGVRLARAGGSIPWL